MAEFQTPSNSFLKRFTSDKMTKIKLKRLKLTFSFFPGNLHKKIYKFLSFFVVVVVRFLFVVVVVPDLLTYSNVFIV